MMRSFRLGAVAPTPGSICTSLETSRLAPALFSIWCTPKVSTETGLSVGRSNRLGLTKTSLSVVEASLTIISIKVVWLPSTCSSSEILVSKPTILTMILWKPGCMPVMVNVPSIEVFAPREVPCTCTVANSSGSLFLSLMTRPWMIPVWAKPL